MVADWPETSSLVHVSSGLVHFRLETSAGHEPTSSHSRMSGAILRCTFSTLAAYGKKVYKPTTSAKKQKTKKQNTLTECTTAEACLSFTQLQARP